MSGNNSRVTGAGGVPSGPLNRLLQDRDVDPAAEEFEIELKQAYSFEDAQPRTETGTNFADNMRQLFSGEDPDEPRQGATDRAEANTERCDFNQRILISFSGILIC